MLGDKLSPEAWNVAKAILTGEDAEKCSHSAAAKAAGVTLREFRAWIKRSEEQRPDDEPWVWEIAQVASVADESRADRLLDLLWKKAHNGDRTAITRLLERLDPGFKKGPAVQTNIQLNMPSEDAKRRLGSFIRLNKARAEHESLPPANRRLPAPAANGSGLPQVTEDTPF